MAETKRDNNGVYTMTGVLNTNGATPTRMKCSTSHILDVSDGTDGSDFGQDLAARDNSGVPVLCATDADGLIIPLYVDADGKLLTKST